MHIFQTPQQSSVIAKNITLSFIALFVSCTSKTSLPDPLEAGWQNQSVCEELQNSESLRVLKCTFPPGVGHEKHHHDAHFGYTIAGSRFRITDSKGTREVDVPTGSNFFNEEIVWHEVLNIGDSTAVFLIIEPKS
ncbi:MAG: cupin domain-containing protein [Cyclobacteriaceae bacterium]|nr:cupin domain-containing protein [Cyclobacteriaceae bacterium]